MFLPKDFIIIKGARFYILAPLFANYLIIKATIAKRIHTIPLNNCPIPELCPLISKLKRFFLV
ncbi:hypothetical protein EMIT079MI2_390020 [Bacillus sp. IT-79MI2]